MKVLMMSDHFSAIAERDVEQNLLTNLARRLLHDEKMKIADVHSIDVYYMISDWNDGVVAYDVDFKVLGKGGNSIDWPGHSLGGPERRKP